MTEQADVEVRREELRRLIAEGVGAQTLCRLVGQISEFAPQALRQEIEFIAALPLTPVEIGRNARRLEVLLLQYAVARLLECMREHVESGGEIVPLGLMTASDAEHGTTRH
jgi:hypothetical protein